MPLQNPEVPVLVMEGSTAPESITTCVGQNMEENLDEELNNFSYKIGERREGVEKEAREQQIQDLAP
jgi:hypothetical protein